MNTFASFAARAALGVPFVLLGLDAVREPGGRVQAAEALGLPEPELMVRINGGAMVAGGAALTLGILPRAAAAGLIGALVPTTIAGHAFWKHSDPAARTQQRVQFLKNVAMAGGLLAIAAGATKRS